MIRLTNNSEIKPEDVKAVTYSLAQDTFSVHLHNGQVRRLRNITLTDEGREFLRSRIAQ